MKPPIPPQPLYLARATYRLRRLMDAARLLPVLGLVLIMLPLMRMRSESGLPQVASEATYLFAVWLVLVLAALALSRALGRRRDEPPGQDAPPPPVSGAAPSTTPARKRAAKAQASTSAGPTRPPGSDPDHTGTGD